MPYSERTFLLLGIGITLIGVGWWVLTHVSFEADVRLVPAAPVATPLPEDAKAAVETAPEESASPVSNEGELLPELEVAPAYLPDNVPSDQTEPVPETLEVETPNSAQPEAKTAAPSQLPVSEITVDTTAAEGQRFPLPESSVAPPDAGRDTPIQMMPLRTEPATHVTAPESDGALPEE